MNNTLVNEGAKLADWYCLLQQHIDKGCLCSVPLPRQRTKSAH